MPEPLHCVIVAEVTELIGRQLPKTPPPANEPMHWLTVAGVIAAGLPVKWLRIVAAQVRTLPPPLAIPLHCWTSVTSSADAVVVVVHKAVLTPPTFRHLVTVTEEGAVAVMVPVTVT